MKIFKKVLVSMLAAIMVILQTSIAFAADSNKITINNAGENHVFTAYQIFAGSIEAKELKGIRWGDNAGEAADIYQALKDASWKTAPASLSELTASSSAAAFAKTFSEITSDSEDAKTLGSILGVWVTGKGKSSAEAKAPYEISSLADGYYLVKDSISVQGENDFVSDYIVSVACNVTMNVKGSIPAIEKKIAGNNKGFLDETSAQVGDIIGFRLDASLPSNFDDYDKYMLAFNDRPSENLAVRKDSVKVFAGNTEVSARDYDVSAQGFTVSVADVKRMHDASGSVIDINKDSHIYVTYEAELTSGITPGVDESNKAYLTYSNDPHGDGKGFTTPDEVKVHVYSVEFVKTDGTTHQLIDGAVFELFSQKEGADAINLIKISDTEYKVADSDDNSYVTEIAVKDKTTGIIIKGLKEGTYYLNETVVPLGYNKPTGRFEIKACEDSTDSKAVVKNGIYQNGGIEIQNNSGTELPATGGKGTKMFMLAGSAAALLAGIFIATNRRMSREKF